MKMVIVMIKNNDNHVNHGNNNKKSNLQSGKWTITIILNTDYGNHNIIILSKSKRRE